MSESKSPIVIDAGSDFVFAGFAGDNAPRVTIPAAVSGSGASLQVGDQVQGTPRYPMDRGSENWDEWTALVSYVLNEKLNVNPAEHPILFTEPPLNSKTNREKVTQIAFETFNVPAFYIANRPLLGLYGSGRTTGLVMHSEGSVSYTVPIYEGYTLPHAVIRTDLGARHLSNYLEELLAERGYSLNTQADRDALEEVKKQLCYVALDFEQEMQSALNNANLERTYTLPSGQQIVLGTERFKCPEALFQTGFIGMNQSGIHEATYNAISKCDVDIRAELYANIISADLTHFSRVWQSGCKKKSLR
jgi:actin-related protein